MTVLRSAYLPPAWFVDDVHLVFDLDPHATQVQSTLSVRRNPVAAADAALVLDGEGLELLDLCVDGERPASESWHADERTLTITGLPDHCTVRTTVRIDPRANTALSGLYESSDGLFTQCEAQGFRRITWFPDRPDVMARYTVTLRGAHERYPILLSNGNLVASGPYAHPTEADWHQATWHDPFPKPSYLFALVAGRLAVSERRLRTRSGREVLLQAWVEPGNEGRTVHALDSLERAIRWDEERFGLELDLDRFMIVAVGDFNMGAMENKGLNIFNSKYVLADPEIATDRDFAAIESVVGHEYFHNWTGNRVTCRDWFQLTLKEGLTVFRDQEFSADMLAARQREPGSLPPDGSARSDAPGASDTSDVSGEAPGASAGQSARAVKRIEDVRLLRSAQFAEDAGPMAHPVRPDAYEEIDNFYTVTVYEKGAEIIRMLQTLVGRSGFRHGLDRYFERHDGQAVTCEDFVAAIGDANGLPLERFRRWYAQAGTPRVRVRGRHDPAARRYELTLEQHTPATPGQADKQPLHIPFAVGLVDRASGRDLPLRVTERRDGRLDPIEPRPGATGDHTVVLELTEDRHEFVFDGVDRAPVASLGRDFSAPVIIDADRDDDALALLAARDSDPFNRWDALQQSMVRAILALIDAGDDQDHRQRACARLTTTVADALADTGLDPACQELLFTLPSEGFVAEQIAVVDPIALRAARNALSRHLAVTLAGAWRTAWQVGTQAAQEAGEYAFEPSACGRRALKNVALGYWVETGAREAIDAAVHQFDNSNNLTDRIGAVQALLHSDDARREQTLARFGARYADEPLVLDKWFMLQATMHRLPGEAPVLERVRELMRHPAFSMRNPNRLRALVGSFCHGNLAEFHAPDGSGYAFWEERVLETDRLNPQIASRLARALDRWRKFDPQRQQMMQAALERVARTSTLSNEVREIVEKSLAGA